MRILRRRIELLRGSIRLLKNWRELFLYGVILRKRGVHVNPTVPLRFRSGLEISMVSGGYGGYTHLFHEIFIRKDYQPTPDFVAKDGWTVLDIGANMGFFTCQVATSARDVRVVAVEPATMYANVLRENIRRNELEKVQVIQAAASDVSGAQIPLTGWYTKFGELKSDAAVAGEQTKFGELKSDAAVAGELQRGWPGEHARVEIEVVTGLTMNDLFEQGKIDRCDLLKVDIEGAEYALFASTPTAIWDKIQRVVMEAHPMNGKGAKDLMELLGRQGFLVSRKGHLLWAVRAANA